MKKETKKTSYTVAFCALMAALGTALMATGGLIPVATYCSPLLAGLLLLPVLVEFGAREGWMVWAVTAALSLILSPDKEAGSMYLFLGWYPILKPTLDRIPSRAMRILAKLLLFTLVFVLLFVLLTFVMGLEDMKSEMLLSIVVYAMLVGTMLLFDRVYERMRLLYERRLRNKLIRKPPTG